MRTRPRADGPDTGDMALEPTWLDDGVPGRLPRPVALVLGGGASLGAAQVGMLAALADHRVVPDLVVGCSVGALHGALVAADPAGAAQRLAQVWAQLRRRDVFPLRRPSPHPPGRGHHALLDERGLRALIKRVLGRAGVADFADLALPFTAVATDAATGAEADLTAGDLTSALLASTALPGLLPPVHRDDRDLVDGGLAAVLPVRAALNAGAASLLVLPCGHYGAALTLAPTPSAATAAWWASSLLMHQQAAHDLQQAHAAVPTVLLAGGLHSWPSPWSFTHTAELIDAAHRAAAAQLDGLGAGTSRSIPPVGAGPAHAPGGRHPAAVTPAAAQPARG